MHLLAKITPNLGLPTIIIIRSIYIELTIFSQFHRKTKYVLQYSTVFFTLKTVRYSFREQSKVVLR